MAQSNSYGDENAIHTCKRKATYQVDQQQVHIVHILAFNTN